MAIGILIFFIFLVAFYRKRNTRAQDEVNAQFWARENEANAVRRQDISGLPYISIPFDNFPLNICENSKLQECENTLRALSEKKILNLAHRSNTDLKLEYGAANLAFLTECDENFTTLCCTLAAYGEELLSLGYVDEARTVLEFGISCGSDVSKNYLLLADIYRQTGDDAAYHALVCRAELLDSPMKTSILQHLETNAPA